MSNWKGRGGYKLGADVIQQLGFAKTIKQAMLALFFDLSGVFAGFIVAVSLELFPREPWIIALYPGILSMRGVIGGLFSGRLSTGLHLGTVKTKMFGEKTKSLHFLWGAIAVLSFVSSLVLGLVALLFQLIFWGTSVFNGLAIFSTLVATMGLSVLAISPLTITVAFSSFRKGLDPDVVVYPIMSTVSDILVTLCYVLVLSASFLVGDVGFFAVLMICAVFACFVIAISYKLKDEAEFARTLREAFYTLIIVAFIVNITGAVLSSIGNVSRVGDVAIGHRQEILVVYPALINIMGDVGAIVGSTATTKFALGAIKPSFKSIKNHRNQIAGAWIASVIISAVLAAAASLSQVPAGLLETLRFTALLVATNVFTGIFLICVVFGVAILTFRRGLDPDNFVIPVESSLADAMTTVSLLAMLGLIG